LRIDTFLNSGFTFTESEYELKLFHTLVNSILTIVVVMFLTISFIRYIEESYIQSYIDLIVVLLSIITVFYIRNSKENIYKATPLLLSIFFILVSYSFKNVGMFLVGSSWFIVLILLSFFLAGIRIGAYITVASLISLSLLSFTGKNIYTLFEYFYVLTPMLMSILFIYLYEKRNIKIKELLTKKNLLLKTKSQDLSNVIQNSSIELYIVDRESDHFLYVNSGATNTLGYTHEEMLQMSVFDINPSLSVEAVEKLKVASKNLPNIMNITEHQKKDGTRYGVQSFIHPIRYNQREAYVIYDIKISDEKKAHEEILRQKQVLAKQAHYDTLTSLPNRALFYDRLHQAMTKSKRYKKKFALMFLDLDKFKEINDALGHDVGDIVLIEIASRLQNTLREIDTVARLAGDEFLIIIEDIDSKESIAQIARILLEKLSIPITLNKIDLYITASIGISIYPDHTQDSKVLVKHADQAMYKAKNIGKNNFQFYDD